MPLPGVDFPALHSALRAWVMSGTGLGASRVVFADGGDRPEDDGTPYVSISVLGPETRGHDGVTVRDNPASTLGDGQEIEYVARGVRQVAVRLQAFGGPAMQGSATPVALLSGVVASRVLPDVAQALQDAEVGVGTMGRVQWIAGVVGGGLFEPRASLDVTCFVGSERSAFGTFIQKVRATPEINGEELPEFEVDGGT